VLGAHAGDVAGDAIHVVEAFERAAGGSIGEIVAEAVGGKQGSADTAVHVTDLGVYLILGHLPLQAVDDEIWRLGGSAADSECHNEAEQG
jgi:hypothetical protein